MVTGQSASGSIDVSEYRECMVVVRLAAVTGTSPTLDIDVEFSDDNSNWHKDSDITQITDSEASTARPVHKVTSPLGKFMRLVPTIGGSDTPTFNDVNAHAILKT